MSPQEARLDRTTPERRHGNRDAHEVVALGAMDGRTGPLRMPSLRGRKARAMWDATYRLMIGLTLLATALAQAGGSNYGITPGGSCTSSLRIIAMDLSAAVNMV
jgi:hypothetical protein